jgi:hypothetical protein
MSDHAFQALRPVVRSAPVKEPLKAPFIFLFMLLCATLILSALNVLYTWGMYDSATRAFSFAYVVQRFPRSISEALIPSVVLSIVLLGLRMARKPFSRFLGLVIVLVVSYAALVNGMIWIRTLSTKSQSTAEVPRQYIQPSTFIRIGDSVLSARALTDGNVQGILLYDPARAENRLSVYPAGSASTRAGVLTLTTSRPQVTLSGSPAPSWTGVFAADRFTELFLRDIHTLTADFEKLRDGSLGEFFAACLALLFLCAASLALLRLTRWPLANIMLLVIAVRGYFSLYHLLATTIAPQVAAVVTDAFLVRLFPSAALAALGVILTLVDILFIPPDRWTNTEAA